MYHKMSNLIVKIEIAALRYLSSWCTAILFFCQVTSAPARRKYTIGGVKNVFNAIYFHITLKYIYEKGIPCFFIWQLNDRIKLRKNTLSGAQSWPVTIL